MNINTASFHRAIIGTKCIQNSALEKKIESVNKQKGSKSTKANAQSEKMPSMNQQLISLMVVLVSFFISLFFTSFFYLEFFLSVFKEEDVDCSIRTCDALN